MMVASNGTHLLNLAGAVRLRGEGVHGSGKTHEDAADCDMGRYIIGCRWPYITDVARNATYCSQKPPSHYVKYVTLQSWLSVPIGANLDEHCGQCTGGKGEFLQTTQEHDVHCRLQALESFLERRAASAPLKVPWRI
jgi:hypothetical protein